MAKHEVVITLGNVSRLVTVHAEQDRGQVRITLPNGLVITAKTPSSTQG